MKLLRDIAGYTGRAMFPWQESDQLDQTCREWG